MSTLAAEEARDFHVNIVTEEVVSAEVEPPPEKQRLRLSNLDLLLPEVNFSFCSYFKKPHETFIPDFGSVADTLKKALSKVLVAYYPLAGEVVTGAAGEPEILCTNRGVCFIVATADVELQQLNFHVIDQSVANFIPKKKHGIIAIQTTELKCGSIVISCTMDHRVADGYSANMFFVSLIEVSRSQPLSFMPSFERSLLRPRQPLLLDSSVDLMYTSSPSLPPSDQTTSPHVLINRIYYIDSNAMNQLQILASSGGCQVSKFESFSAFLWKIAAKHVGRDDPKDTTSKLGFAVDGRRRLAEQETKKMKTYFGNVISTPFGEQRISDLIEKPLSWVAREVHEVLETSATNDHFLGLIDYVETHRPRPVFSRIHLTGCDEGPAIVVSSGREFLMTRADFEWGPPVFGSTLSTFGGKVGFAMPMPSPVGNGDWLVYLRLTKDQLNFVEEEASHVFKPLNNHYLGINTMFKL